jgi:hypothetical protein
MQALGIGQLKVAKARIKKIILRKLHKSVSLSANVKIKETI